MTWLPIESAPKHSRKMFAVIAKDVNVSPENGWCYTTDPYYVWWSDVEGFVRWPHPFPPTHWHPMPEKFEH